MIPIVCSGRSGAFPDQVELGNALDLFIVACLFRKPGFHPSGQAQGHAFPGHALAHSGQMVSGCALEDLLAGMRLESAREGAAGIPAHRSVWFV
jgi:hypothetical protein